MFKIKSTRFSASLDLTLKLEMYHLNSGVHVIGSSLKPRKLHGHEEGAHPTLFLQSVIVSVSL